MGRFGAAILTIVGTIVGSYFGYPALGTLVGSLAGSLLFPQTLPNVQGPRLSDITQTNSTVGAPIPRGWGTFPASGNVIAQTALREVIEHEEVGGKGAPTQTINTPTYYQDFAIGLNDGLIAGIRTIWANGKAIYDRRPRRASETDQEYGARLAASDKLDQQMVVYLGTETQLPDPTLEAFYGVGEIGAFRGLAYVVFVNWQNRAEDGNRMPATWKFEVYTIGTQTSEESVQYSNEELIRWTYGPDDPRAPSGLYTYEYEPGGHGARDTLQDALDDIPVGAGDIQGLVGWSTGGADASQNISPYHDVNAAEDRAMRLYFPRHNYEITNSDQSHPCQAASLGGTWWSTLEDDGFFHGVYVIEPVAGALGEDSTYNCVGGYEVTEYRDVNILVTRIPGPPLNPCDDPDAVAIPELPGYVVKDGDLEKCGAWTFDDSQTYRVLTRITYAGSQVERYPQNPALPLGHALDTEAFWTEAYLAAVAAGDMPDGLTFPGGYPQNQSFGYFRALQQVTVATDPVPVSDIVRDLCREAGLQDSDFDTADLAGLEVIGYVRTRVMAARAAIDPLRQGFFFDGLESAGQVKFVRRGGPIRHTFIDDELGVALAGEEMPSRVTTKKAQDVDLPRQVRIHYLSQARDYEQGEQDSPVRISEDQAGPVNDIDAELPMVLDDTQALRIAQTLWADQWAGRWSHSLATDARFHDLEPTDVVAIPVDGRLVRARIDAITDTLPSVRKFDLTRDDDGAFVSYAVAGAIPYVPPPISFTGPIEALLLDLPALRDQDDDAGFYAAARPLLDSTFRGGALYRSIDGGGQFTQVTQFATAATIGKLKVATPAGPSTVWDEGNEIVLTVQTGALESRTREAVLAGANAIAVGAHGRWEILQFRDADQIDDTTWRLSGLLRGRRGTEANIGTGLLNDRWVLISGTGIIRVPLDLQRVGAVLKYRAVAVDGNLAAALTFDFEGDGEALRPFSPVQLAAERSGTDLLVTWTRRGRLGQELPSGADIPLSEEAERYDWEVRDLADLLIDSGTVTAQAFTADLTGHDPSAQYRVLVYQISATVGRGHVGEAVL